MPKVNLNSLEAKKMPIKHTSQTLEEQILPFIARFE
jgi:hypothetical protein